VASGLTDEPPWAVRPCLSAAARATKCLNDLVHFSRTAYAGACWRSSLADGVYIKIIAGFTGFIRGFTQ
jgi:hypothetical protein